jgi:type I restriction enzyme S subunit
LVLLKAVIGKSLRENELKSEIEVPEGWGLKSVGDLFDVKNGTTPSTKQLEYWENGSINWFTPADLSKIKEKNHILESNRKITKQALDKCNLTLMPHNSLIISCRAPVGYVAILNEKAAFNQGCKGLIAKSSLVDYTFYLYYLLYSKKKLQAISGGSTFKELSKSAFLKFKVPYPPLPEQQKIADILSKVDEQIQQTEKIIDKTEELKKGLMQKLLTRGIGHTRFKQTELGEIPEEWEVDRLDSYVDFVTYGFTNPMPESDKGPYIITVANINNGKILFNTCRKTTQDAFDNLLTDKSRPMLNDILLTKDGTLGRLGLVNKDNCCINQSVALLRPNKKVIPLFLKYLLESPYYQKKMKIDAGGSTIKHIYITIVDKMKIAVPNLKEQQKITGVLSKVDEQIQNNKSQLENLKQLKKGLMQDLLTGRVRVTV